LIQQTEYEEFMAMPRAEKKHNFASTTEPSGEQVARKREDHESRYREPPREVPDEEVHAFQSGGQKGGQQQGQRGGGKALGDDDRSKGGAWTHGAGRKGG